MFSVFAALCFVFFCFQELRLGPGMNLKMTHDFPDDLVPDWLVPKTQINWKGD